MQETNIKKTVDKLTTEVSFQFNYNLLNRLMVVQWVVHYLSP